ncbi:MAG: VWA domain-containing protein [Bryobacteraceae bacterium]|jgi:VWFA-related protein
MRYAAALALAVSLAAQNPQFNVQSRLVLVPVTVTDAEGRPIDGLEASDFLILDNGRPQTAVVDSFTTGVAPLALVVAVQSSGISAAALAKVRKIGAMIQPLVTGESGCAALVAFAERVEWRQDCTSDNDALARAFLRLQPEGEKRARMLDAVYEAIERLRTRPNVRRVVLVISESRDRGSETSLDTVVIAAQAAGVTIYAAPYSAFKTAFTANPSDLLPPPQPKGTPPPNHEPVKAPVPANVPIQPPQDRLDILGGIGELARLGKTNTTHALTGATGGAAFPFARQEGLEDAIQKLGAELHTQYVLSYTPQAPAPGYHRLEVRLRRRGDFRLRARPGYWAAPEPR